MKKRKVWMALALALVMAGAGIGCAPKEESKQPSNRQETKESQEKPAEDKKEKDGKEADAEALAAPDFVVFDQDGKQVKLSEFKGQASVVNFWASW